MKKRSIISIVLLMVVTGLIFSTIYSFTAKPQKNIGLQLYSIRDSIMKNVPAAIAKVGKMGYKFVEPANYDNGKLYGMEPAAFKALCLSNGLTILSSHVGQSLPDSANLGKTMAWWDACIDAHVAAGAKFLIQPFMGDEAYRSLDTLKLYCDYFNKIGEKCKDKGIQFGYHNHDREFSTKLEGQTIYDFMLTNTDPQKVTFEMDLYWAVMGGANPVDHARGPGTGEEGPLPSAGHYGRRNRQGARGEIAVCAAHPHYPDSDGQDSRPDRTGRQGDSRDYRCHRSEDRCR